MGQGLTILIWLVVFGVFTTFQSWFINGIFASAAGETEKYPDGTDDDSEMLLYPIKKYLTRTFTKLIYYQGDEFDKMWKSIRSRFSAAVPVNSQPVDHSYITSLSAEDTQMWMQLAPKIKQEFDVDISWQVGGFLMYKSYEIPLLSKYLRKPIITCVVCMSSVWGSLTFWIPALLTLGYHHYLWGVWVADIGILAYYNLYWLKKSK